MFFKEFWVFLGFRFFKFFWRFPIVHILKTWFVFYVSLKLLAVFLVYVSTCFDFAFSVTCFCGCFVWFGSFEVVSGAFSLVLVFSFFVFLGGRVCFLVCFEVFWWFF